MEELLKLAKKHKNLVVLSATGCEEFSKYFPERCFSFGWAEANMVSAAAGFALAGKMPVVIGNGRFLFSKAFDQIQNDICIPNLNVKIIGRGDERIVKGLKNMKVLSSVDFKEMALNYGPTWYN